MDNTRQDVLRLYDVYFGGFTDTDRKTNHREAMREQVKAMPKSECFKHILHAQDLSLQEIMKG